MTVSFCAVLFDLLSVIVFITKLIFEFKVNEETLREKRETIACDGSNMQQAFSFGERQLTFKPRLQGAAITNELRAEKQARHLKERKELRRDTREITRTLKKLPIEKKFKFRKCRH